LRGPGDAPGAYDYLIKPFNNKEICEVVAKALAERILKRKFKNYLTKSETPASLPELMGPSDVVARIDEDVHRVAQTNFTVMILGETGVGKELVARAIHGASPRAHGSFVPVDWRSDPGAALRERTFGVTKRGLSPGRTSRRQASSRRRPQHVFLDEISNMPIDSRPNCCACCRRRSFITWAARRRS